jgi:hypothetical protein
MRQDVSTPLIKMLIIQYDHVQLPSKNHPENLLPLKLIFKLYLHLFLDLPMGRFARGCPPKLRTSTYTVLPPSNLQGRPITVITANYLTPWKKVAPEELVTQEATNGLLPFTEEHTGIYGGQSGAGLRFLRVLRFPPSVSFHQCSILIFQSSTTDTI